MTVDDFHYGIEPLPIDECPQQQFEECPQQQFDECPPSGIGEIDPFSGAVIDEKTLRRLMKKRKRRKG